MDEKNFAQSVNNNVAPAQVNTPVLDENKPAKGGKMKKMFYVLIGILTIAVVTVLILVNLPKEEAGSESETETTETSAKENTVLSGGTVSTTIGGKTVTYKGAYVVDGISATIYSGEYASTEDDEAVFLVINGGSLMIEGEVKVSKTGSADFLGRGDTYSFYGTNSAIVVVGEGSSATIDGATIETSVSGANAVVATDSGKVSIENSTISTTKDNSRGLHATYGGTIKADTVSISTLGGSCATLATDRGAGTVIANNMTLSTAGAGSPLIYSTGEIYVANSTGTATGAQIAVVEGKNLINLRDCEFFANGIGNRNNVDNAAVMIYQSMSGDASVGKGEFVAVDSTLKILEDSEVYMTTPFFFVTNTEAEVTLDNVTTEFYEDGYFVMATGTDEWGKSGANGGTVVFSVNDLKTTNYNVGVDEISSVSGL